MKRIPLSLALVLLTSLACNDSSPDPPDQPRGPGPTPIENASEARLYERNFAFIAPAGDSLLMVPWLMETASYPDTVIRETRGWLSRGSLWEAFYVERWGAGPTRAPERILPHRSLSITVREGDAIETLLFEEGARRLELVLGSTQASWVGPRGETIELVESAAYLSDQRVDGLVLDMARAWSGDGRPPGDWAFLTSGDSVQLVLAAGSEHGLEADPVYRAWARIGGEEFQWPETRMDWSDAQAFPPARRDVPIEWRLWSADESISGVLEARASEMLAGVGPPPLLPVLALLEVEGEITAGDRRFPVRGLLVHRRR